MESVLAQAPLFAALDAESAAIARGDADHPDGRPRPRRLPRRRRRRPAVRRPRRQGQDLAGGGRRPREPARGARRGRDVRRAVAVRPRPAYGDASRPSPRPARLARPRRPAAAAARAAGGRGPAAAGARAAAAAYQRGDGRPGLHRRARSGGEGAARPGREVRVRGGGRHPGAARPHPGRAGAAGRRQPGDREQGAVGVRASRLAAASRVAACCCSTATGSPAAPADPPGTASATSACSAFWEAGSSPRISVARPARPPAAARTARPAGHRPRRGRHRAPAASTIRDRRSCAGCAIASCTTAAPRRLAELEQDAGKVRERLPAREGERAVAAPPAPPEAAPARRPVA